MNKHILVAMDRKNRTQDELRRNVTDAAAAVYAATYVAYDAAAHGAIPYNAVADAAANAAAAYAADSAHTEYWLAKYFDSTGEDKQDYIDAIEASK